MYECMIINWILGHPIFRHGNKWIQLRIANAALQFPRPCAENLWAIDFRRIVETGPFSSPIERDNVAVLVLKRDIDFLLSSSIPLPLFFLSLSSLLLFLFSICSSSFPYKDVFLYVRKYKTMVSEC